MTDSFWYTLCFPAINLLPLVATLIGKIAARFAGRPRPEKAPKAARPRSLNPADLLNWEFEYARTTTSEAMEQRHTLVNFYLLLAGFVIVGVATVLKKQAQIPPIVATVLLWFAALARSQTKPNTIARSPLSC